ncbi:hypothetical protein B0H13DRAFT_1893366 [Mycena leptocephala]|nr:hypothetical protein B0H13DRAFT_1893366 [Mycena leptocephala]
MQPLTNGTKRDREEDNDRQHTIETREPDREGGGERAVSHAEDGDATSHSTSASLSAVLLGPASPKRTGCLKVSHRTCAPHGASEHGRCTTSGGTTREPSLRTPVTASHTNTTKCGSSSAMGRYYEDGDRNASSRKVQKKAELLEQTYQLLNAIMMVHIESDTGGELPPSVLNHIGKFTETLHKIHTFVEAQQVDTLNIMNDITKMQEDVEKRHKEVLDMIEVLSDRTSSDGASSVWQFQSSSKIKVYSGTHNSSKLYLNLHATIRTKDIPWPSIRTIRHPSSFQSRITQGSYFSLGKILLVQLSNTSPAAPSLLILDNLETLWEPTESRANIEEFLSLLTGVEHLALVPLKPLDQDAAQQTFIDIADNTHNPEEVEKVLALTDNMPLAINLLAHLVDSEGCSNVLSRWEEEKTSVISEGYDKRSNLDLSISLSLSSTRLDSFPHSKDLLSLLAMLPDGLSDVELVQAKLPIDNILGCKAALIRTTLAYSDEHKRLKALVPIREYMQKNMPPGNHLVHPLFKHFKELLELLVEYYGTQSSSATVARISSNYSNIQNILWNGAQQGHPDLVNIIYCACDFNQFSILIGQGTISFTAHIPSILPQPCDHHLEAYYMLSLVNSLGYSSTSVTEMQVSEALEHFKYFDDPDLQCRLYNALTAYYRQNLDISTAKDFCERSLSLALSTQNTKMQCAALTNLAWINWSHGDYFTAQGHAKEAQGLARISADLYREGLALNIESMCWYSLGNYKQSISLCSRARDLITLCGLSSGQLDHSIMTSQAEIHKLKSEYVAAHSIHSMILQETSADQDSHTYGIALLNVAEIDAAIGTPKEDVQGVYEKAREIFSTRNFVTEVVMCDASLADLSLREANFLTAKTLFESCLKPSFTPPEIMSYCLERLGNTSCWGAPNWMSGWTTVFLVHSVQR